MLAFGGAENHRRAFAAGILRLQLERPCDAIAPASHNHLGAARRQTAALPPDTDFVARPFERGERQSPCARIAVPAIRCDVKLKPRLRTLRESRPRIRRSRRQEAGMNPVQRLHLPQRFGAIGDRVYARCRSIRARDQAQHQRKKQGRAMPGRVAVRLSRRAPAPGDFGNRVP